jgi:uncharacterized membrane protein YeaQ/YmgE (transglycosylase-associated protein family)
MIAALWMLYGAVIGLVFSLILKEKNWAGFWLDVIFGIFGSLFGGLIISHLTTATALGAAVIAFLCSAVLILFINFMNNT